MLLAELDEAGFRTGYDFVYLPFCFETKANVGYAFVNFISEEVAESFLNMWNKTKLSSLNGKRPLTATYADVQGLKANVQRLVGDYKIARISNPRYQPAIFENGSRVNFRLYTEKLMNNSGKVPPAGAPASGRSASICSTVASTKRTEGLQGKFNAKRQTQSTIRYIVTHSSETKPTVLSNMCSYGAPIELAFATEPNRENRYPEFQHLPYAPENNTFLPLPQGPLYQTVNVIGAPFPVVHQPQQPWFQNTIQNVLPVGYCHY